MNSTYGLVMIYLRNSYLFFPFFLVNNRARTVKVFSPKTILNIITNSLFSRKFFKVICCVLRLYTCFSSTSYKTTLSCFFIHQYQPRIQPTFNDCILLVSIYCILLESLWLCYQNPIEPYDPGSHKIWTLDLTVKDFNKGSDRIIELVDEFQTKSGLSKVIFPKEVLQKMVNPFTYFN